MDIPTAAPESPDGTEYVLPVPNGSVRIAIVAHDIVRLRIGRHDEWRAEETFMLDGCGPRALHANTVRTPNGISIKLGDVTVSANAEGSALYIDHATRSAVVAGAERFVSIEPNRIVLRLDYRAGERVYGAGQGIHPRLDLRGVERRMWHEVRSGIHPCSNGLPLLLNTRGYAVFLNSSHPARFVIGDGRRAPPPPLAKHALLAPAPWGLDDPSGEEHPERITIVVDHDQAEFYFMLGSLSTQLAAYRSLTGAATLLPRWALGFIQSRNRYRTQAELLAHMREFRRRNIPVDVAVIDWYWFRTFGDLDWDRDAWPDPDTMVRELTDLGIRLMQAQHPYIDRGCIHWECFKSSGFLVVYPTETRKLTAHDAIYDYTNPAARELWWNLSRRLFDTGVRAWWIDQVQPEVHPEGSRHFIGSRERVHNIYALLMAKCLSDGQRDHARDRVFTLSFAGYSGMQRYGVVTWSGDVDPSWQVMREQIIVGQQMSLSGQPWWTTDGGGYVAYEFYSPELLVRWLQWGAFSPVFRTHSKRPQNEPWIYGPQWEPLTRASIALRYRMLPYIQSVHHECHRTGLPPVRPMVLAFEGDPCAAEADTQYMFGGSLLVAPIFEEGARSRDVYLPPGTWTCWWTKRKLQGGRTHRVFAPIERIPLFARAGAIIPEGIDGPNADAVFSAPITFHLFPGADGSFDYVEDDGWSTDYESGAVRTWTFDYRDAMRVLHITRSGTGFAGESGPRRFELIVHEEAPVLRLIVNGRLADGRSAISVHDPDRQAIRVILADATDHDHWQIEWQTGASAFAARRAAAVAPWVNISRPDARHAWIDALVPVESTDTPLPPLRLSAPSGWIETDEPVPLATGDDTVRALRWKLDARGPEYVGTSPVMVHAPGATPITAHLTHACLGQWQVLGLLALGEGDPLDSPHPVEERVDLAASHPGIDGAPVTWRTCSVLDCTGYLNLVGFLEGAYGPIPSGDYKVMKRLAYCVTWVHSDATRTVDFELEGEDRFRIWVNDELALVTHAPAYTPGIPVSLLLRAGWNRILVKAVQDGRREWGGRRWGFYLRPAASELANGLQLRSTAIERPVAADEVRQH